MPKNPYQIQPIGQIRSPLTNLADAPLQGDEDTIAAWLEFSSDVAPALLGINIGDQLMVLTWLHLAHRDILQVHPRGNPDNPLTGVFATRSPHRPNPIGLHRVSVLQVESQRLKVAPLEAIDGTPILDIKPVLTNKIDER